MDTQRRPATIAEAQALASATRLQIIRLCLDRTLTNKEIADRLGVPPATALYHIRKLVVTGFLSPGEVRPGPRGSREVPYQSTGKSWILDVEETGVTGGGAALVEAFLAEIRLVDIESERPGLSRLGLRLTDESLEELKLRTKALLDEYVARPPDPDGRAYSLFLSIHRDHLRD